MNDDEIVNDLDSMPFDGLMDPRYERPILVQPRKCRRHDWRSPDGDAPCAICGIAWVRHSTALVGHPFRVSETCSHCGKPRDPAVRRRNVNNRKRGKRTSHELAVYLGGQDVEACGWPWDVQGDGYRLQSKRLAVLPGRAETLRLIEAIPEGAWLRGFYYAGPRQRLASGTVTMLLREWVSEHGWELPAEGVALGLAPHHALITLPLSVFRDLHVGGGK